MASKIDKQAAFFLSYMFIFGAVAITLFSFIKGDVSGAIVLFLWAAYYYVNKVDNKKKIERRKIKKF